MLSIRILWQGAFCAAITLAMAGCSCGDKHDAPATEDGGPESGPTSALDGGGDLEGGPGPEGGSAADAGLPEGSACEETDQCAPGLACVAGFCAVPMDADTVDADVDGAVPGDAAADAAGDAGMDAAMDSAVTCRGDICDPDQHCEGSGQSERCVYDECDDITCPNGEVCKEGVAGVSAATCVECLSDLNCSPAQYCADEACVDDICVAGARRCVDDTVWACTPNGADEVELFTCVGGPTAAKQCIDDGNGTAGCGCNDDWDCPEDIACEAGLCVGRPPECLLSVEQIDDVQLEVEIAWGGVSLAESDATGSPFPDFSQAVMTPAVANLDDDNGDGLINELDVPEIIFLTYETGAPAAADALGAIEDAFERNGVLRAIHGGGPDKGEDFFAACGDQTWHEGDALDSVTCDSDTPTLNPTGGIAVADLNNDGVPEIVAMKEDPQQSDDTKPRTFGIEIFDNLGNSILRSDDLCPHKDAPASPYRPCELEPYDPDGSPSYERVYPSAAPTVANLDSAGFAEIIAGRFVFTLEADGDGNLAIKDVFEGRRANGSNVLGPISCAGDLVPEAEGPKLLEVMAGTSVYRVPADENEWGAQADCPDPAPDTYCEGKLQEVWDAWVRFGTEIFDNSSDRRRRGFCAVADVWGADTENPPGPDNPLDGSPELITISNGWIQIFGGITGEGGDGAVLYRAEIWPRPERPTGTTIYRGGAPNVDDFDGDGFPEIGSAFSHAYVVVDLQASSAECPEWSYIEGSPYWPDGSDIEPDAGAGDIPSNDGRAASCLHNGWKRFTEDDGSRATGSSVFDLNGDGAAEVLYHDECYVYAYDGLTGAVLFREPAESRTRIDYPVVADVDNDGNAEIVLTASNDTGDCDGHEEATNNGIEVWGDPEDLWAPARRIWNQHAYHVTNVFEDGRIPMGEPDGWVSHNGRLYNTYRSNPRTRAVAPDLTITDIQLSSPDASCGELSTLADIVVRIENGGDLRVGPGVRVVFQGKWGSESFQNLRNESGLVLLIVLESSIEPGQAIRVTASYDASNNDKDRLPDTIRVIVDENDRERECDEGNNRTTVDVNPGEELPDLRPEVLNLVDSSDPDCAVGVRVHNDGSAPASDVVVGFFAGNPERGGTRYHQETIAGPIQPGESATTPGAAGSAFPLARSVRVFVVADPDNEVEECNDGNNVASRQELNVCSPIE